MTFRRLRPVPRRSIVAAAAALAMLLATTGVVVGNTAAGSATTTGVTSTQITIGATVPLTGPAAPGYSEIAPAINAVFKWVNSHGGIYGRKIKYIYLNDKYDPTTTATLTRKL
ncbi:MAG: ABC transporter substrate-binding protein, partial [Acidimicrobiales bacterium]